MTFISLFAASECNFTWTLYSSQLARDGIWLPTVVTLSSCQSVCVQNASCLAIDFDASNRCFIHTDPAWNTNIELDKPNVDQYVLSRLCPGSSTIPVTSLPTSRSSHGSIWCTMIALWVPLTSCVYHNIYAFFAG